MSETVATVGSVAFALVLWLMFVAWVVGILSLEARSLWRATRGRERLTGVPTLDYLKRRMGWPYYAWRSLGEGPTPEVAEERRTVHLRLVGLVDQLEAEVRRAPWSWWRLRAYVVLLPARLAIRVVGSKTTK